MEFRVAVTEQNEVHVLPGDWPASAMRRLLELADADDIGEVNDADVADIVPMALQDLGVQRAGECVLEAVFGDNMRAGVRQNLVDDLQDDRPWDEFPDIRHQRGVFTAVVMLHQAFPGRFGTPDATELVLAITPEADAEARDAAARCQPDWLLRVLGAGQSEDTVLRRMFADELAGAPFADADALLWHVEPLATEGGTLSVRVLASNQWLAGLADGSAYTANLRQR